MESTCPYGCIQISKATHALLSGHPFKPTGARVPFPFILLLLEFRVLSLSLRANLQMWCLCRLGSGPWCN